MNEALEHLLVLADLDTSTSQLLHRRDALPEASGLHAVESELALLEVQRSEAAARREDLAVTQQGLEAQIGILNERRSAIEQRMYAATGSAVRDLQAMNEEVMHLAQRHAELEELELDAMIDQDPVDVQLAHLRDVMAPLQDRAAELRRDVAHDLGEIDGQLAEAAASRAAAVAALPTALARRYDTLRVHLRGSGAARLVGHRCDGCHLELSSVEVEKIRALPPDQVATCEQCGRILIPV